MSASRRACAHGDAGRSDAFVQLGERVRDHPSVGEGVPGPRRCLRPVGVDAELPGSVAADVDPVHEQLMPAGHLDAAGGPNVAGVGEQQLWRQHAAGDRPAGSVEVGQHGVHHPRPLHQTGFEGLPVRRGDDHRQRVEMPRTGDLSAVPVCDGVTGMVHLDERDAVVVDEAADHRTQPLEAELAAFGDAFGHLLPGRSDTAHRVDELVVAAASRPTYVEERLLCAGGPVFRQHVIGTGLSAGAETGDGGCGLRRAAGA